MKNWYYYIDGHRHGPVDSRTLCRLAEQGHLFPSHKVWRSDLPAAVPAVRVRGLFKSIQPKPPDRRRSRAHRPAVLPAADVAVPEPVDKPVAAS